MHTLENSLVFPKRYLNKDNAGWRYTTADDNTVFVILPFRSGLKINRMSESGGLNSNEASLSVARTALKIRTANEAVTKLLELEAGNTPDVDVVKRTCTVNRYSEFLAAISEVAACMFSKPEVQKNIEAAAKLGLAMEPVLIGDIALINRIQFNFTGSPYHLESSLDVRLRDKLYIVLNTFDAVGNIVPSEFGFGQLLYTDLEVDNANTEHLLLIPRYISHISTRALGVIELV